MGWMGISQRIVTPSFSSLGSSASTPRKSPLAENVRGLISYTTPEATQSALRLASGCCARQSETKRRTPVVSLRSMNTTLARKTHTVLPPPTAHHLLYSVHLWEEPRRKATFSPAPSTCWSYAP